ncbi:MAG: hypothetical protein S4CHLAM45_13740 [Chlamydiales bacterium]|nr:hypothetical protein [Chlamydiales bacterium]MCH9620479.1 hypothetical protein [Chlamydiales bacterium]MCH9623464.1 hypothetical protein [Chlamydiales bacterium]
MLLLADLEVQGYNFWPEFVNMMIALVAIIGFAVFSVWFMKRVLRSKWENTPRTSTIRVIERKALGPKSALYLVDILGKGVVVGESQAGGLQLIKEFSDEIEIENLMDEVLDQPEPGLSLKERLAKKLNLSVNRA